LRFGLDRAQVILLLSEVGTFCLHFLENVIELLLGHGTTRTVGAELRHGGHVDAHFDEISGLLCIPGLFALQACVESGHFRSQPVDHIDEFDIIVHDIQGVFFVDLTLFLESATQRVHTVFEELFLVIELVQNVGVFLADFWRLILDIFVE